MSDIPIRHKSQIVLIAIFVFCMHIVIICVSNYDVLLIFTDVPAVVPGLTVENNTIIINGNIVTLRLSWGEPFNNFDPIVNYTVSCLGDDICPPNFTTTDNRIIITNLATMTTYTFSVVATNSIGSGEAGVVMITTPPGDHKFIFLCC